MSDSRRNSAFRLRGYNRNSVNNSNLKKTGALDNHMAMLLALIVFSSDANLGKKFGSFVSVIYFGVLVLNIIPEWG